MKQTTHLRMRRVNIKPLIDFDILLYEVGCLGQYVDEETQEIVMKSFDVVMEAFDQKVSEIEAEVWATEPSVFFMTNNKQLYKTREKKKAKALKRAERKLASNPLDVASKDQVELYQPSKYEPNFRDKVAKKKQYKGNRKDSKRPLHYENLVEYVSATREVIVAEGCEADDLLAIYQCASPPLSTIICSRDKDLKIVPGMHFGWACGKQQQWGPAQVTTLGKLELLGGKKLVGDGLKFFYSQILTGDPTDDYPGLPRCGPIKAFKLLEQCNDEGELFEAVYEAYKSFYGEDSPHDEMKEQANLAWMVCERNDDGSLKHYQMYDKRGCNANRT